MPSVIVAECVWVLRSFYDETRADIARTLSSFVTRPGIAADDPALVVDALERMGRTRLDYVDCYLAARGARTGEAMASFDGNFRKFDDIVRWVPD